MMRPADALCKPPPTLYYDQMPLQIGDDLSAPTGINIEALKPLAKGDDVSVRSSRMACHVCVFVLYLYSLADARVEP